MVLWKLIRWSAYGVVGAGALGLAVAPFAGQAVAATLWLVEPVSYISVVVLVLGLGGLVASYALQSRVGFTADDSSARWAATTQRYFDLFHHDLGRPIARIVGKERQLRDALHQSEADLDPSVAELLAEIEVQAPSFRLMMSNIQVLVQLEGPAPEPQVQSIEPTEIVRRIALRYMPITVEAGKQLSWWSEPDELGIFRADASAIDHIVTNLVDNAVRFATTSLEIKLSRNDSHFFVRVWDDGPGIPERYLNHLFERGWTPQAAQREEKTSSGLGMFIARTLAEQQHGELTVESVEAPDPAHHTAFLLSLPVNGP